MTRGVAPSPAVRGAALAYAGLGVVSIAAPGLVPATFGAASPPVTYRTEIRAVYGGLPLAFAGLIEWAAREPASRRPALLAVGVATAGMAAGRVLSSVMERRFEPWPHALLGATEIAIAVALLRADTSG